MYNIMYAIRLEFGDVTSFCVQIPPAPPKPDFDEPRHKLAKLREGIKPHLETNFWKRELILSYFICTSLHNDVI